jgi:hypothetical protein
MEVTEPATSTDWQNALATKTYAAMSWQAGGGVPTIGWWGEIYQPGAYFGDQHGWRDNVLDRLYKKALRQPYHQAMATFRQFETREITNADMVGFGLASSYAIFVSKKIGGVTGGGIGWTGLDSPTL